MNTNNNPSAQKGKGAGIKNFIINILKGMAMGVAVIVPGFSGGTVAVVLGIYYGLIDSLTGLFKHFRRSFLFLLPFLIGIAAGVVVLIFPINYALANFPLLLICLFVGLMLGGVPPIAKEAGLKNMKAGYIIAALCACALAVGICFLPELEVNTTLSVPAFLYLALAGFTAAAAFIVPGISGSMIAMAFGVYDDILSAAEGLLRMQSIAENAFILLPFGLGVVCGFLSFAFAIKYFMTKFPRGSYFAILGFLFGSVAAIFISEKNLIVSTISLELQIILSVVLFALGLLGSLLFVFGIENKTKKDKIATQDIQAAETEPDDK